jgi:hypothetical protein
VGDPGCGRGLSYSFTGVNDGDVLALPFGTWSFSSVSGGTNRVTLVVPLSNTAPYQTPGDTVVTLDPRTAG